MVVILSTSTSNRKPGALMPNLSLRRSANGMALGPRGARCHHPPRGPSAGDLCTSYAGWSAEFKR